MDASSRPPTRSSSWSEGGSMLASTALQRFVGTELPSTNKADKYIYIYRNENIFSLSSDTINIGPCS